MASVPEEVEVMDAAHLLVVAEFALVVIALAHLVMEHRRDKGG